MTPKAERALARLRRSLRKALREGWKPHIDVSSIRLHVPGVALVGGYCPVACALSLKNLEVRNSSVTRYAHRLGLDVVALRRPSLAAIDIVMAAADSSLEGLSSRSRYDREVAVVRRKLFRTLRLPVSKL